MLISSPSNEPLQALEHVTIDGPTGPVDAAVEDPGAADSRYAIVCHPHPLFGGTMDNKVVTTVAKALSAALIPTIRFNFRGVGGSVGIYDEGIGETADAAAAAEWGAQRWPGRRLLIAGFSFGAYVALRLAQTHEADCLITIAPPVGRFDFAGLKPPRCRWLVVQGDADDVVDPQVVADWVGRLTPMPQLKLMQGTGHFFHGRLHELRDAVKDAVRGG